MTQQDIEEGKGLAIISYLTIIGTIIAYFMNNDKKNVFTSFHVRQSLGLWLTYFVLAWVVSAVNSWFATLGFWAFFGILFIYAFINAVGGKALEIPLVGAFYQKIFSNLGR
ncbi:membrane protein [Wocania ichthyoenteri]|uniref:membrane protein n=1 Tax=Wocania ichthyoenteri TaxID=1230531 RepID=UPI00053EF64E|nr:membrane protein [Wocania ichthyoenteri]